MDIVREYLLIGKQADRLCMRLSDAQDQFDRLKSLELEAFRRHDSEGVELYHKQRIDNRKMFAKVGRDLGKLQKRIHALSDALSAHITEDYDYGEEAEIFD